MKTKMKSFLLVFVILISGNFVKKAFSQSDSLVSKLAGSWVGILDIPNTDGMKFVISFRIENGKLKSWMKNPDQSAAEFPCDSTGIVKNHVYVELRSFGAKFEGFYRSADTSINGTFTQNGQNFDLELKPYKLNRPQEPKPPFPYEVKDVEFENKEAGITLSGTLTIPATTGLYPVVVLISGSGPQDRNEEIFEHKPFFVIADYLTRNGIAVLRYDDRGTGKSKGNYAGSSIADFASDAEAAIDFLKKCSGIDSGKIGLIGHSEGGMIASLIASRNPEIAFIVLMAGPGVPGDQLMLLQAEKIYKSMKISNNFIETDRKIKKKIFRAIKNGQDSAKVAKKIVREYSKLKDDELEKMGISKNNLNLLAASFLSDEIRSLIRFNPAVYLKKVSCPVLALNGENDMQVPPKENLAAIEAALKSGGNKNYTIKELWYLNHLFQTCETGSLNEYGKIEETVAPVALETMRNWILGVVTTDKN